MIPWSEALPVVARVLAALAVRDDGVGLGERFLRVEPPQHTAALARLLYEECFIKGLDEREPARAPGLDLAAFVAELRASNAGHGRRSDGWQLIGSDEPGRALVAKDGRRWSVARELVHQAAGDRVELHAPCDGTDANYYFVYGDALPLGAAPTARTRYYVNLESAGAARLVASATRALNGARVPFSLKCFRDPHDYYRRDGAVVYADRGHDPLTSALLRACTADVARFLRDPPPMLTCRLGPGLASAPDPDGESYGQRCCGFLARALLAERPAAASAAEVVATAAVLERDAGSRPG